MKVSLNRAASKLIVGGTLLATIAVAAIPANAAISVVDRGFIASGTATFGGTECQVAIAYSAPSRELHDSIDCGGSNLMPAASYSERLNDGSRHYSRQFKGSTSLYMTLDGPILSADVLVNSPTATLGGWSVLVNEKNRNISLSVIADGVNSTMTVSSKKNASDLAATTLVPGSTNWSWTAINCSNARRSYTNQSKTQFGATMETCKNVTDNANQAVSEVTDSQGRQISWSDLNGLS